MEVYASFSAGLGYRSSKVNAHLKIPLRIISLRHTTGLAKYRGPKLATVPPEHAIQSMLSGQGKAPGELYETVGAEDMRLLQKEELKRTNHAYEWEQGGRDGLVWERLEGASGSKRFPEGMRMR